MITNPYSRNIAANGIPQLHKTADNIQSGQEIGGNMASSKGMGTKTFARYPDDQASEHEKLSAQMDEEATLLLADEIGKAERNHQSRNHPYPLQFAT